MTTPSDNTRSGTAEDQRVDAHRMRRILLRALDGRDGETEHEHHSGHGGRSGAP